jgi:hypothetical protein
MKLSLEIFNRRRGDLPSVPPTDLWELARVIAR